MPPRPHPARRLSADERRQQILRAAREMLQSQGLDGVSVESAARRAGVSPGLLFHYFGSQGGFRDALLELVARELLDQLRPDPSLSPAGQLRSGIDAFIAFVGRHPSLYLAVVRHTERGVGSRRMAALHRNFRTTLADWIAAALTAAGTPATPALATCVAGWLAFVEEAVLGWLAEPSLPQAELAELCERGAYALIAVAVDDPVRWPEIRAALQRSAG